MKFKRLRWQTAAAFTLLALLLLLGPMWMLFDAGRDRITEDLEQELATEVQRVQLAERRGETEDSFDSPTWIVSIQPDNEYTGPYDSSITIRPPGEKFLREAEGEPEYRGFNDGDQDYLAYILPIDENFGLLSVAPIEDRDDRIATLRMWMIVMWLGLGTIAGLCAWWLTDRALGPARRIMGDQQGFLADAAHEMRTPLAVILASSSQALSRSRPEEEYVRSLAEIRSAAERASTGVNAMLDLVRFDSGQVIPRLAPLRLDLLAEEIAAAARHEEGEVVSNETDPVVVQADMALLRQAIENVVRNAARRANRVEIVVRADGRDGLIEVLDNGPGFDPAIVDKVFDRYQRGDRRGNAGIGLAIVRAIVNAHGGEATAANRDEGGAVVRLRIPAGSSLG